MINDLKRSGEWKVHLTMKMNFMSLKDRDAKCLMHSKSYNEEIMNTFDTEETIEELFHSLLHRHQVGLEQSMKDSQFVFEYVDGLFYRCSKSQPWWMLHRCSSMVKKQESHNNSKKIIKISVFSTQ